MQKQTKIPYFWFYAICLHGFKHPIFTICISIDLTMLEMLCRKAMQANLYKAVFF